MKKQKREAQTIRRSADAKVIDHVYETVSKMALGDVHDLLSPDVELTGKETIQLQFELKELVKGHPRDVALLSLAEVLIELLAEKHFAELEAAHSA